MKLLLQVSITILLMILLNTTYGQSDGIQKLKEMWFPSYGEFENYEKEKELWYPGEVKLTNGQIVQGKLNFNFVSQALMVDQEGEIKTFAALNITHFTLKKQDSLIQFFSLPVTSSKNYNHGKAFYEMRYSNSKLAILSRHSLVYQEEVVTPTSFDHSNLTPDINPVPGMEVKTTKKTSRNIVFSRIEQFEEVYEHIYLANKKGDIFEYATAEKNKYSDKTIDENDTDFMYAGVPGTNDGFKGLFKRNKKELKSNTEWKVSEYKIVNKNALENLMGAKYDQVLEYIRSERLQSKSFDDMIHILDYYESLF